MESQFEKDLAALINEYSKENDSDTPDFILARYLNAALDNFNAAIKDREQWYGREKHVEDLGVPFDEYDGTGNPPPELPSITSIDLDNSNPIIDLES